jgi:endonuclease/exonuclease/phosphatase family metal-dependent hydrolase
MLSETPITLLFWNIHKRPEAFESIARLADNLMAQVLMVAEMPLPGEPGLDNSPTLVLLDALNRSPRLRGLAEFSLVSEPADGQRRGAGADAVQVYSQWPARSWERKTTDSRYTIWKVSLRRYREFHVAAVHFTSSQNDYGDGQRECAIALRHDLEGCEQALFRRNGPEQGQPPLSIVMGDLNASPWDPGVVGVYGLNATPLRATAASTDRIHQGRHYPYLFNPMWRFLRSEYPGTYYGKEDAPVRFDWYLLDQILVRPSVLTLFDRDNDPEGDDVRILIHDGERDLVDGPLRKPIAGISDHLPIMFRFRLPERQGG